MHGREAAAADPERETPDAGDPRLRRSTADGDGAAADAEQEAAVLDTLTDVVLSGARCNMFQPLTLNPSLITNCSSFVGQGFG